MSSILIIISTNKCFLWPKCTKIPTYLCECSHIIQFVCKDHRYKYTQDLAHKLIKFQVDFTSKKTRVEFIQNLDMRSEEIDKVLDNNIKNLKNFFDDTKNAQQQTKLFIIFDFRFFDLVPLKSSQGAFRKCFISSKQ